MYVFRLSCPSAAFPLQRGGFVPREWLAAKGLFSQVSSWEILIGAIGLKRRFYLIGQQFYCKPLALIIIGRREKNEKIQISS